MTIIDELSSAARTVADAVGPATVSIGRAGRGTGFVVAPGKVLTNAHNLRDHTTSVTFADGRTEQAAVAGVDPDGDLVVLDVDTADVAALAWGEAAPAADVIFAVGRGGHRFRVSLGLVSGTERAFRGPRGRRINGSIEHTAALARGSSGGPVVDQQGRVVGVNTSRVGDGFYLAQPADAEFQARVAALAAGRSVVRRSLGVAIAPAKVARKLRASVGLSERDGLLVRGVEAGSPADRSGIDQGDLLVAAGGTPLTSVDDVHTALDALGEADTIEVTVVRGDEERTVTVSFAEAAADEPQATSDDAPDPDGTSAPVEPAEDLPTSD